MQKKYEVSRGYINSDKYKDFVYITKKNDERIDEIQCEIVNISISSKLKNKEVDFLYFSNSNIIGCDKNPHAKLKYKIRIKKRRIVVVKQYLFIPDYSSLDKKIVFYYNEKLNNLYLEKTIEMFSKRNSKKQNREVKTVNDFGKISFSEYNNQ